MRHCFSIALLIVTICLVVEISMASTFNVPSEYLTVQEAIDAPAVAGDIILVSLGTYYPNDDVVIPEGVKLSGEHWDACTIDLGGVFQIQLNDDTVIEGFKIINPPDGRDIILALNVGSVSIKNNIIQGNQGVGNGIAAIFLDQSVGIVENNIINGENTGIRTRAADNSLVFNNIIVNTVYSLLDTDSSIFSMDYNLFWNNSRNPEIIDTNNILADPQFIDINDDDYRLCSDISPCIDAGHPNITYNDVDDSRNDIGADGGPEGVSLDTDETCDEENGSSDDDVSGTPAEEYGEALIQPKCFIATAAYGTPMVRQVKILCQFRDDYLLTNLPGKYFVDLYYKYSPSIAEYIVQRKWLRKSVRIALWPFIMFSWFMLKLSLLEKLGIGIGLFLASKSLTKKF